MTANQVHKESQARHSMQEILLTLGRRIRRERQRMRLSQEGFAGICGLHRTEMGLLERGKTIPRLDMLLIISQHLAIQLSRLLQGLKHLIDLVKENNYNEEAESRDDGRYSDKANRRSRTQASGQAN